jgi:hypothetical protein
MHHAFDAQIGPLGISDKLLCFCVFFVWLRVHQQVVSVAPICHSAPSGCIILKFFVTISEHALL